ncbi:biogenesis of lysosome-related organelles complex 1 subunit 3 [Alligator mississippiensis]|uniref:Biogenesis of lysosome-related organelles complex 1 subunit 3 n=2 Tax=Alligator mississippiensis TaxID=8496 RepID=A0A151MCP5_ALLMI|nr:biogenesis of lysosome-related organelles complex 1 subunit 3 [Alligator mississippiensis]
MSAPRGGALVPGEASETDSEAELELAAPRVARPCLRGVKVPGEASETDDEDEGEGERGAAALPGPALPPLVVVRGEEPRAPPGAEEKPALRGQARHRGRYSSLLQQRLADSNARLCGHVGGAVRQGYGAAAARIGSLTAQLGAAQSGIIDASHSVRLALDDLRALAARIDIVTGCSLLPDLRPGLPPA